MDDQIATAQMSVRGTPFNAAQDVEILLVECHLMLAGSVRLLALYAWTMTSTTQCDNLCFDRGYPFFGPQQQRKSWSDCCRFSVALSPEGLTLDIVVQF